MRWLVALGLAACGRTGFASLPCTDAVPDVAIAAASHSTLHLDRVDPMMTLSSFPLVVTLDDSRAARDLLDPQASNIRFLDASGNVLPHEIDQLGTPGGAPLVEWVQVPTISGVSTTIDVTIGGALPDDSTQSVWDTNYAAVYHLTDGHDATSSHHDATPVNSPTIVASPSCAIGACAMLGGANYYLVPDSPTLDVPNATITGWIYQSGSTTGVEAIASRQASGTMQDFYIGTTAGDPVGEVTTASSGNSDAIGSLITLGHWTHIGFTYEGSTVRLFVDGTVVASSNPTGNIEHNAQPILLGAASGLSGFVTGMIDEVHIERTARSNQWVTFEDKAMRDGVITYGPVSR